MQMCANAKERSPDDWAALLALADRRFRISSIRTPPHSALSIIEVVWDSPETTDEPSEDVGVHNDKRVPVPQRKSTNPGILGPRDVEVVGVSHDDYAVKPVRSVQASHPLGKKGLKRSYSDTIKSIGRSSDC